MNLEGIILSEISPPEKEKYLTYMWNLKNKQTNRQTKQNENRLINTENKWVVARGEGCGHCVKQVKGIKINKPWGCNTQPKEYGQLYCNNFVWGQMYTRLMVVIIS